MTSRSKSQQARAAQDSVLARRARTGSAAPVHAAAGRDAQAALRRELIQRYAPAWTPQTLEIQQRSLLAAYLRARRGKRTTARFVDWAPGFLQGTEGRDTP